MKIMRALPPHGDRAAPSRPSGIIRRLRSFLAGTRGKAAACACAPLGRTARLLLRAVLLATLLLGFAVPAQASLLDRVVSWFGTSVRTDGLAIGWRGTITARRIELRDPEGTWATLDGVTLRWAPLRLLRGALDMRLLRVHDATLARLPHAASGKSGGDPLPQHVALHELVVERLTLAPAVAGTTVTLRVEGAGQRRAADEAQARLLATQIGGPARYHVEVALAPSGLHARATAQEPPDGPLARFAGLPRDGAVPRQGGPGGTPGAALLPPGPPPSPSPQAPPAPSPLGLPAAVGGPLVFVATAAGPLTAVTTEASLTFGALHASAHGTVDVVHRGLHLDVAAATPAMAPLAGLGWTDARMTLRLSGTFAAPEVAGRLDFAGLAAGTVRARAVALDLATTPAGVNLRGRVDGLRLPGPHSDLLAGAPVRLTARMLPQAAGRLVVFTLDHPLLQAHGRLELGATPTLDAQMTVPDLAPFAALAGTAARGQAGLTLTATRAAGAVRMTLEGRLGLTGGPAPAVAMLGPETRIAAAATYADGALSLTRLDVAGPNVTLAAHGTIGPARLDLAWQAVLARLEPLNPRLAGHLDAAGLVSGPIGDLALTAALSGAVAVAAPGRPAAAPPTGAGGFTAQLALAGLPASLHGSLRADGEVLGAPLRVALNAARAPDGALTLTIQQAGWKSATALGSLRWPPAVEPPAQPPAGPATRLPVGDLRLTVARLADFTPLVGRALAGSLQADLRSSADRLVLSAEARRASLPGIAAVGEARLQATLVAPEAGRRLDAQLALADVRAGGLDGTLRLDASGPLATPALRLTAMLPHLHGMPLGLTADGRADVAARSLTLAALDAQWHGRRLRLVAPTRLALAAGGGVTIAGLRADLAGGTLTADGQVGRTLALTASLQRLPASLVALFAPSLRAAGQLSADARLSGSLAHPLGTIRAQGSGLHLLTGPGQALPPGRLDAIATLAATSARLTSRFDLGVSHLAVDGTVGGATGLGAGASLALRAHGTIDLALANPVLAARGGQARGRLALDATVGGTVAAPRLGGEARLSGGEYRDEVQGVHLRDLAGRFVADGDSLRLVGATGRAGGGTVGVDGTVGVLRPGLPVALRITAHNATPFSGGLVTADLDADLTLRGLLYPGEITPGTPAGGRPAALSGTVLVHTATLRIPNRLPASVQTIPVRWAGAAPPRAGATRVRPAVPLDVALAVQIRAPQQVFVRGRGLNAELGGTVRLGGSLARIQPSGGLRMIRGAFNLAGQTLTFTSGDIRFQGGSMDDPALHLVASTSGGDTLTVGGTASDPKITLSSPTQLPQDEILAQLLFHTGAGNLSPLQLASVAAGLAELSGGAGPLPNPLDALRGALGLDQLGVGSGASGTPTLRAGRYIGRRLYVGAEQGTGQQSTQGTVTYDLTKRLQLRATAGTGQTTSAIGASGQTTGESVGVRYQFQY